MSIGTLLIHLRNMVTGHAWAHVVLQDSLRDSVLPEHKACQRAFMGKQCHPASWQSQSLHTLHRGGRKLGCASQQGCTYQKARLTCAKDNTGPGKAPVQSAADAIQRGRIQRCFTASLHGQRESINFRNNIVLTEYIIFTQKHGAGSATYTASTSLYVHAAPYS